MHITADICGNIRGNGLFHQNRIHGFYHTSIAVLDLSHKMRLIIISTIHNGAHSIDLLKHGTGKSLSECRAGKLSLAHGICSMDNTRSFVWQVNACPGSKIKYTLCFDELLTAHSCSDLHHTVITGVCNNICQRLCTVGIRPYRTLNKSICTKGLASITYKSIRSTDLAFFQC